MWIRVTRHPTSLFLPGDGIKTSESTERHRIYFFHVTFDSNKNTDQKENFSITLKSSPSLSVHSSIASPLSKKGVADGTKTRKVKTTHLLRIDEHDFTMRPAFAGKHPQLLLFSDQPADICPLILSLCICITLTDWIRHSSSAVRADTLCLSRYEHWCSPCAEPEVWLLVVYSGLFFPPVSFPTRLPNL